MLPINCRNADLEYSAQFAVTYSNKYLDSRQSMILKQILLAAASISLFLGRPSIIIWF